MSRIEAAKNPTVRATALVLMFALMACGVDEIENVSSVDQYGQSTQGQSTQGQSTQGQSTQSSGIEAVSVINVKKNGVTLTGVKVVGSELRANGVTGNGMIGAQLKGQRGNGLAVTLRVDGHVLDTSKPLISSEYPAHTSNSDVHLYKFSYLANDGLWKPLCTQHTENGTDAIDSYMAVVLPGRWVIDNGQYIESNMELTIGCWRGTIAKCVRWGYKPWKSMTTSSGVNVHLKNLHLACVRGAMADYCGTGKSFTMNDTLVDVFDRYGFIKKSSELAVYPNMFSEESSFDPDGAGCVERARWETLGAHCEPTYVIIEPDPTSENYWKTKPRWRQIPTFRPGERSACTNTTQLVLFDTSTYCRDPLTTTTAMPSDCSSCTTGVCSTYPECCDTTTTDGDPVGAWTQACRSYASTLRSCKGMLDFELIL